jgi:hypothetical protein
MEATTFAGWLAEARVREELLTPAQQALLVSAFHFLHRCGTDYYSIRLLSHFLVHCQSGLKLAQIARLLGINRWTASSHQGLSSKEVVQGAHHRTAGRSHGKLLPRYACPVAQFLVEHPKASRSDVLAFIERTWGCRSRGSPCTSSSTSMAWTMPAGSSRWRTVAFLPQTSPRRRPQPRSRHRRQRSPSSRRAKHPRQACRCPGHPKIFFASTDYAGAFLLLPQAVDWLASAEACFEDAYGSLRRGLLTSVFAPVIGLKRIFHLDQMQDRGFAVLTGGRLCPSRYLVGGWRRHLRWYEVDAFCRRTAGWEWVRDDDALVSFDEHAIPRWTHKFTLPKGYVTTRNKYMPCEKLYYAYHAELQRYLCIQATPGNVELREVAVPLVQRVLTAGRPRHLHALFDAGAGKADADVRALWDLAARTPNLTVTLRACRYPHRVRLWKQLPSACFTAYEEPGVCVGAPPKEIRLAETYTTLKGETSADAVRTIVCREVVPGPKKDRWHPLYTSSDAELVDVLHDFRQRQHHEQGYRVGVHDEFMNATPCGYDKDSPDRHRPRFHRGPLQMIGWLLALVYNAIGDLGVQLADRYHRAHVETLRRTFFHRPGQIYCTPRALIVYLDPFPEQDALWPLIDEVNAHPCRLPWLENRILVISLTPHFPPRGRGP